MFRKLKIQLTLINVCVLVLFILFTTASIYLLMEKGVVNQSQQIMKTIATDVLNGKTNDIETNNQKFFFVKTDKNNKVISLSRKVPIPPQNLATLNLENQAINKISKLNWYEQTFLCLKVTAKSSGDVVYVFANFDQEQKTLNLMLAVLLTVTLTCLALSFFGSLYMAEKALLPIKNAWQRQKDFTADASHELRTPLAIIKTSLALIKDDPEEKVGNLTEWVENIDLETKFMGQLVEDLLFLSRADTQENLFDMKYFALHTTIQEVFAAFKPLAIKNAISFKLQALEKIQFYGDEKRIKQLLSILLDNAFKHTPSGGEINLTCSETEKHLTMTVSDTGQGIAEEHLEKIFERFYRVDKARSREEGGSGLGLPIAQWIVKAHGGNIHVTSVLHQGTNFIVTFLKN